MHADKADIKTLEMITARAAFLRIQSKGRKWVSHGLIVQTHPVDGENTRQIGFTVSKKVSKSAVKRNRIKRRLRAVAADILPRGAKPGYAYVLVGRPETAHRPYDQLCRDLRWCLKKLDLQNEEKAP